MMDYHATNVVTIRAFSRFYTSIIGLLDEGLLESPYTMTEARVLFELGQSDETDLIRLRNDLGVDSGYMTRILHRLQKEGLIVVRKSTSDGRHRILTLTSEGSRAYAMLNQRSADQVATLLQTLNPAQQRLVATSMEQIQRLLSPPSDPDRSIVFRNPHPGDYGWIIERHGQLYAEEFGWDTRFEALVASIVADFAKSHDPERERCWIAERDGMRVGCVFVVRQDYETAKLRLLIVDPLARGTGLGRALVQECIEFARNAEYRRLVLWTNNTLVGARHIYETERFQLIEQSAHADFGKPMIGEVWELTL
jgi:DNA-binding MarR family transcriptional regulator/GNAT superfamily N-acetyltransferase